MFQLFLLSLLGAVTIFQAREFSSAPIAPAFIETWQSLPRAIPNPSSIPTAQPVSVSKTLRKSVTALPKTTPKNSGAQLEIPKINVHAAIKEMGLTSDGAMAVPDNRVDVGWFSLGTRPGDIGSAVVGGHNQWDHGAGVFDRLDQLENGDAVSIVDAKGITTSFVVRDTHTYDATDEHTGIFVSESGAHLNLITCSGVWNPVTKTYAKRLVVFTDLVANAVMASLNDHVEE